MNLWQPLHNYLLQGQQVALVLVKEARGSVPREAGAGLVVLPDGGFHGTIGGGALEWEALQHAAGFLKSPGQLDKQKIPLGPNLGQCCGGHVVLTFEKWSPERLEEAKELAEAEANGLFSVKSKILENQVKRELHSHSTDEFFGVEQIPVAIFGAGHVGKALILALALAPTRITWVDTRTDVFPETCPKNVSMNAPQRPEDMMAHLVDNTLIIILTHSHALDLSLLETALKRGFPFVGVIGSETKRARFVSRLQQAGMSAKLASSFHCPIGIPGIIGKEPSVIAASVTAQLLMEKSMLVEN
ncbi:MAG: xanthine dehydrogenase accessory protein XdhC [Hyphomicrobiales bacterium]